MADTGLLNGLAGGLNNFTDTYFRAKQMQQTNDLQQAYLKQSGITQQEGLLKNNMQVNPQNQQVEYNDVGQQQKQLQQNQVQQEQDSADPNSDYAQSHRAATRAIIEKVVPGASNKIYPDTMSPTQFEGSGVGTYLKPMIEANAKVQAAKTGAEARTVVANINSDARVNTQGAKAGNQQNKAFTDMVGKINSFRGNKAVANSADALRAVGNAEELIHQYPDLNQMPQTQVALLGDELAKIAGGGAATEGGRKEVNSDTYASKWQQFKAKVGNEPTGADLGKFIQNNVQYLAGLKQANQKIVNSFRKDVYDSYEGQLNDDQKQKFQGKMHPELFQDQSGGQPQGLMQNAPQGQSSQGLLKSSNGAEMNSGAHPQDSAAVQWAKSNPQDPRAKRILQINEVQ